MIKLVIVVLFTIHTYSTETDDSWYSTEYETFTTRAISLNEKITEEYTTKTKPIVRDQDGFGTCYAFATTSLMDQACMKEGTCSKKRSISVLDVIAKTQFKNDKDYGLDGGHMSSIAKQISSSKDLHFASESCAPYQQIENYNDPDADFNINDYPRLKALGDIYQESSAKVKSDGHCLNCNEKFFKKYYEFNDQMIIKLNAAVAKLDLLKSFKEFLEEVLVPEKCRHELSQIKLPKMRFVEDKISSLDAFRSKIIDKVKGDKPVAINACTWKRACMNNYDSTINCSPNDRLRVCAAHAFLVDGHREICEGSKCRKQYRVHNSWGKDFEWLNDNGWVNEDTLYNGFKGFGDQTLTTIDLNTEKVTKNSRPSSRSIYRCNGIKGGGDESWALKMINKGYRCSN